MNTAFIDAIGLIAPGLPSWRTAQPVLRAEQAYTATSLVAPQPALLPPNERRRAPLSVRLALQAAEEALTLSSHHASELASVFASSDAEMEIIHRIAVALAEPARMVSPTDFHNSVHNAAAGYWGIAAAARRAATTISGYDGTLITGLRESLALLATDEPAVLLVLYDVPPPPPLYVKRPIACACAVAWVLTRNATENSLAQVSLCTATEEHRLPDPGLEALRLGNPAARALPVLSLLAAHRSGDVGVRSESGDVVGIRIVSR